MVYKYTYSDDVRGRIFESLYMLRCVIGREFGLETNEGKLQREGREKREGGKGAEAREQRERRRRKQERKRKSNEITQRPYPLYPCGGG